VKRIFVVFLLCTHLLIHTEVDELFRLPALVGHILEHKNTDADFSVYKFILEHYVNDDAQKSIKDSNPNLPYKSHEYNQHSFLLAVVSNNAEIISVKHNFSIQEILPHIDLFPPTNGILSSIWQPPKA
jgi:hypothetical protein